MATAKRPAITIENIRCSYVTLAKARAMQEGQRKTYSVQLMFDKKNPKHMEALKRLAADLDACYREQFPGQTPPPMVANKPGMGPKIPIKDADVAVTEKFEVIAKKNPEFAGHYILRASKGEDLGRPVLVGPNKEMLDPSEFQSGYWYNVNVNAFAFTGGSGGATVGLNGVQFVRKDAVFGGSAGNADDMFGTVQTGENMAPDPFAANAGSESNGWD